MSFSKRTTLLDRHRAVAAYAGVAEGDPILGRIGREMHGGLAVFMARRAQATT